MKVTYPHMGNAWIVIQTLCETLDVDFATPPQSSKRTLNLGTKLSPESACLPLKINLGNYIEAAEAGADTIMITGGRGPCRFGYYGELEHMILRDAGYDFEVVVLEAPDGDLKELAKRIRYIAGPKNSWAKIIGALKFAYKKSIVLDQIEDIFHKARPRLNNRALTEKLYGQAKDRLLQAGSYAGLQEAVVWTKDSLAQAEQRHCAALTDSEILRIGVTGEIYTILDPFSSLDLEQQLGNLGVEVDRSLYLSGWVAKHIFQGLTSGYRSIKQYHRLAHPYLAHFVGGHGQESVGAAIDFARRGFDGVIQLLPLNCMPEIVAASILPRVQEDYQIPIMTLTVDEHTGKAGLQTRLEAFVDLLERSRQAEAGPEARKELRRIGGK